MKMFLIAAVALAGLCVLGACSNLPSGEPEQDMPIYGSSTPR